jgi:hypothetical protein
MTCPQCNADLPETATFCHTCGSPVRSVTFSYLPPGTPAWPSTVPPLPLAVADAQTATEMEGERRLAATKPLSARPKRSARSVLIITALFILVPLVAIGATLGTLWYNGDIPVKTVNASLILPTQPPQTPTTSSAITPTTPAQTNQLPTPSSYQATTIPEVGIALKYPIEWPKATPQTSTNSVLLEFHPQQRNGVEIFIERFTAATSAKITSTNDVNQGNLSVIQSSQGVTSFHAIAPTAAQITVGGAIWDEQDATFVNSNGLMFHLATITVQHNQLYYNILYYAPSVVYSEAMQKYFQPMLDSFQFQS